MKMRHMPTNGPAILNPDGGRYTRYAHPPGQRVGTSQPRGSSAAAAIVAAGRPSENQIPVSRRLLAEQRGRLLFGVQRVAVDIATEPTPPTPQQLRAFNLALGNLNRNFPYDAYGNAQIVALGFTPPSATVAAPQPLRQAAETWMICNLDKTVQRDSSVLGPCCYVLMMGGGSAPFRRTLAEKCLQYALLPAGPNESLSDSVFCALFGLVKEMPDIVAKAEELMLSADFPMEKRETRAYKALMQG